MIRLIFIFSLLISSSAHAGYSFSGYCFASLSEAVTINAASYNGSGWCQTGSCRILSYVPATQQATVINGTGLIPLSIAPCDNVTATLPSYMVPTPWYGSDPGTVSACGQTVSSGGGITGSSGGVLSIPVFDLTLDQARNIAQSILYLWAIAFVFRMLRKQLDVNDFTNRAD